MKSSVHEFFPVNQPLFSIWLTQAFAKDEELRPLAHRFELVNRSTLFGWVAEAALPAVAGGDFHHLEHLTGWRPLVPCERDEEALVAYMRSPRPVDLARIEADVTRAAA